MIGLVQVPQELYSVFTQCIEQISRIVKEIEGDRHDALKQEE